MKPPWVHPHYSHWVAYRVVTGEEHPEHRTARLVWALVSALRVALVLPVACMALWLCFDGGVPLLHRLAVLLVLLLGLIGCVEPIGEDG